MSMDHETVCTLIEDLAAAANPRSGSIRGTSTTIGVVLNGTAIDFMIPGSPADQEDALENKDVILAVDNHPVDASTVKDFIKGADQIGSTVKLSVEKAEGRGTVEVVLKRAALAYVHHMQVYQELFEQLRSASRKDPEAAELVRRVGVKVKEVDAYHRQVKEVDAYHRQVEQDLRQAVSRFAADLPRVSDMVRGLSASPGASVAADADETAHAMEQLQEQLRAADASQRRLRDQLAAAQAAAPAGGARGAGGADAEKSRLQEQVRALERGAADAANEVLRLKGQLRQSQASARQSDAGGGAGGAGGSRKDHYIVMEDQIEELTIALQDAQRQAHTAEKELHESRAQEAHAQEQVMNLNTLLEKKVVEASGLQAEVYRLNRSQDRQGDVAHLAKQLKEAEFQLQQAITREGNAEVQLGAATQQASETHREARLREKELQRELAKQQEAAQAAEARAQTVGREREKIRASEKDFQARAKEVQSALEELQKRSADEIARLQRDLQQASSELASTQTRLQRSSDQLNDALESEHRLKILANEAHTVAETMHDAKSDAEKEFMDRINMLEEDQARAQTKIAGLRAREQDLSARENNLNRRLAESEEAKGKTQGLLREVQADLNSSKSALADLQNTAARADQEAERKTNQATARAEDMEKRVADTTSKLRETEHNLRALEENVAAITQASERKDQQIRDLEVRSSDVEDKYAEALEDAQKQLDEFGSHSRARDWQTDALKEQLQVAGLHSKKANQRESELLRTLEETQSAVARLECSTLQQDLACQQQVSGMKLKAQSLLDELEHLQNENASLRRLIDMPPEELAAQTQARASMLSRNNRRSSTGQGPQHRASSTGVAVQDDWAGRRSVLPQAPAPRSRSSPPREDSTHARSLQEAPWRRSEPATASVPGWQMPPMQDQSALQHTDADLAAQVARLRQRMHAMDSETLAMAPSPAGPAGATFANGPPPAGQTFTAHGASPAPPASRASLSPQATQLLQSLNAAQYTPQKTGQSRSVPQSRPSAGGAGFPMPGGGHGFNNGGGNGSGTPRSTNEPKPLFAVRGEDQFGEKIDQQGISNWLI